MISAIIDTNIFVSGLLSEYGNPAKIINAFYLKRFNLYYNTDILAEYTDVLYRNKLGLNLKAVNELLEVVIQIGFIAVPEKSGILLNDEDDRIFYDTAIAAGAYLVTGNTRHYPAELFIKSPAEFTALLDGD